MKIQFKHKAARRKKYIDATQVGDKIATHYPIPCSQVKKVANRNDVLEKRFVLSVVIAKPEENLR